MIRFFTTSATEKVFLTKEPRPQEGPVFLFAKEDACIGLCIRTDEVLTDASFGFSGGPAARHIRVQRVGLVPAPYPCSGLPDDGYDFSPDGLYPDVLEDCDPSRLGLCHRPDINNAFFLTISDSDKIAPGDHTVTVRLCNDGRQIAKTSFVLRKLAVRLPEKKCISTAWMHYDSFITQHHVRLFTKDFYKLFASYLDAAVYSGQDMLLVPLFTPAFDTQIGYERKTAQLLDIREDENGNFSFDFTAMHRFIAFVRERGIRYLEMPPLFTQWGALCAPKIMVKNTRGRLVRRFGWHTDSLSEEYRRFLTALLPALNRELRSIGMEENTFFHISDEPSLDHLERYTLCKALVLPLLGKSRTLDACSHVEFAGKSDREYAVCLESSLHAFRDAGVLPLCTYYCCAPAGDYYPNRLLAQPLSREIVLGAALYRYDISLFLHWGFNFYNSTLSRRAICPYGNTDADYQFPAGDSFIVYPDYAGFGANHSLRLVGMRLCFRLLRMLTLLEEFAGRDYVLALLDREGYTDINVYPRKADAVDRLFSLLSEEIAARIA